jgi:large subunit ribosomal protein L25
MKKMDLQAQPRILKGKKVKEIRLSGLIPAVVYGREIEAVAVAVEARHFKKVISGEAGTNIIINLKVGEGAAAKELPVITYAMQRNPLTDDIIHVDFRNISMTEKIKTKVPVELVGLPIGVKESGGVLVHNLREIEVECLPTDIPDKFTVEVSGLAINHSIQVANLVVPSAVTILSNPEDPIAMVTPPSKEEVAPPPAAEGEAAVEGAVPAEGAAAAEGEKAKEAGVEKGAEKAAPAADKKAPSAEKKAEAEKKSPTPKAKA